MSSRKLHMFKLAKIHPAKELLPVTPAVRFIGCRRLYAFGIVNRDEAGRPSGPVGNLAHLLLIVRKS